MYRNFFSLSELPFSISPNPKYLFMSDRHKEALSHLTYGLSETGGFALLTGEVGTGKTTISRCLLTQLPENTQTAFILNPTLSSQELLATICDQLHLSYNKADASLKTLTDKISEKLLANHHIDMNTVLIIDEAQHLQVEVLEQLRLLTNLETDTKKLLQVILIGQPELQQLLQRRDLRQLAQRITARYHLMPLTKLELMQYIKHRLYIAGCQRELFNAGALAKIHQLSQGIPRLINLLCHSALMHAYNQNNSIVNKKSVQKAAEQTLGEELFGVQKQQTKTTTTLAAVAVMSTVMFIALAGFWLGQKDNDMVDSLQALTESNNEEVALNTKPVENKTNTSSFTSAATNISNANSPIVVASDTTTEISPVNQISPKSAEIAAVLTMPQTGETEETAEPKIAESIKKVNKNIEQEITAKKTLESQQRVSSEINDGDYQIEAIEGTSPELLALFQAAMAETSNASSSQPSQNSTGISDIYQNVTPLTQMSASFQQSLPNLHFTQHIYSSDGQGWVNVNGRDRYEGDSIGRGLLLEKILPQQVILTFQEQTFSLPALVQW